VSTNIAFLEQLREDLLDAGWRASEEPAPVAASAASGSSPSRR
jgi:hypothetical protein